MSQMVNGHILTDDNTLYRNGWFNMPKQLDSALNTRKSNWRENLIGYVPQKFPASRTSPVIPARAFAILEMMKPFIVPDNQFPPNDLRHDLDGVVTITADTQVLDDPEWRPCWSTNQTICDC